MLLKSSALVLLLSLASAASAASPDIVVHRESLAGAKEGLIGSTADRSPVYQDHCILVTSKDLLPPISTNETRCQTCWLQRYCCRVLQTMLFVKFQHKRNWR